MKNIAVSLRAKNTPASAVRKLAPLAEAAKKRGIEIYHLNIGQPDLPTPRRFFSEIRHFNQKALEYAPSNGLPAILIAWQNFYKDKGIKFEAKDILITNGGSEALLFSFLAIADPGDEIIVFEPFYTNYSIFAAMADIKLRPITTFAENGFHFPPKKIIEKEITSKTRGIMVCNPNNPTGTYYTPAELKIIVDLAIKNNLFIISDEVYREMVFDGKKALSLASFPEIADHLIVLDSVSKRFSACGARVGCVATRNQEIIQSILRFAQGRLSVATIEQMAFAPLFKNHKKYTDQAKNIYQKRRNVVMGALKKIPGVTAIKPEGAFYVMPKLPIKDSDEFAEFLLNDFSDRGETVMIAPATGFYATLGLGKDEIRIAYVLEEKKLKRAIELLGMAINKFNKI